MARGIDLTDEQLATIGVSRLKTETGTIYSVPCVICGTEIKTRRFTTSKTYKCRFCESGVARKRSVKLADAKERFGKILAEDIGLDYEHAKRFAEAETLFSEVYRNDIEKARKAADRFDSVPEVIACIELLHIGARVITHQKVGDFTVDFCLPDEKVIIEVDGSLYHTDKTKEFIRDRALVHMLGDGWIIRHIPADTLASNHQAFGRGMLKLLKSRKAV